MEYFESDAMREFKDEKPAYGDMPVSALKRIAMRFTLGNARYGRFNWQRGLPNQSCYDSALRHLLQWKDGDTSEDHLAAAAWNLMVLMHNEETQK